MWCRHVYVMSYVEYTSRRLAALLQQLGAPIRAQAAHLQSVGYNRRACSRVVAREIRGAFTSEWLARGPNTHASGAFAAGWYIIARARAAESLPGRVGRLYN